VALTLLDQVDRAEALLSTLSGVSNIERLDGNTESQRASLSFEFAGDDAGLSSVLSQLVQSGLPVLQFHEDQHDLEEVFLRATKGIVS
jgi:hypothetical protein